MLEQMEDEIDWLYWPTDLKERLAPTIATTLNTNTIHEVTQTYNDGAPGPG
jgi:hypothetical protein